MTEYESAPEEGLDLAALAKVLQDEYATADQYRDTLRQLELLAIQYYEGQTLGNEVEGRSQVVLPDVQETIDYMLPSVVRTFVSGDRTVEFEATEEEDEEAAEEATAAINWNFMRKQDGYRLIQDACMDGLLRKIGVFKTVMETRETISRQRVTGDPMLLGELPDNVEIEDLTENEDGTVTALLKTERKEKVFVDYAVSPSRFRFSPLARHEDDADYLAHCEPKTRSQLVEMGFDRDQVYRLPCHTLDFKEVERRALDNYRQEESSPALEVVLLCEEYVRYDLDGDGIAERLKVYRVENEILIDAETGEPSVETIDDQPFSVFCPFPRPHRLVGYSLAEKVMDIQLARSYVARQLFDGMALANMPRPIVDSRLADADTYNDILNPIPGSPIRAPGGAATVQPFNTGFDIGKSMQAMEWLTGERESRTGITRLNQGLDADALNKTATGTALMQAQGQQQEEYIARGLAETMSRLFLKKYRLMRIEADPFKIKVDGQYKTVDPSKWPEDMNVVIRVGLGSGSKDKRIQGRMMLAQLMAEGTQIGDVEPRHRFKMIDGLVRDLGIGQGDDYWTDPDAPPEIDPETGQPKQKAEKPDPAMMELQAKQAQQQAELQLKQADAAATLQLESQKAQAQIEAMREKHALEIEQKREAAALDAQLANERAAREYALARERMQMEAQLEREGMFMKAQTDASLATNRPGGALDA